MTELKGSQGVPKTTVGLSDSLEGLKKLLKSGYSLKQPTDRD